MTSYRSLSAWYESLARAVGHGPATDAIAELLRGLEQLVDSSGSMLIVYPRAQRPRVTHHRLPAEADAGLEIDRYLDGAYLLDPYYRAALDQAKEGVFALADIAPRGFKASEYYKVYYRRARLFDEICFLFRQSEDTVASISLVRRDRESPFERAQVLQLRAAYPLVRAIVCRAIDSEAADQGMSLDAPLGDALENFGSSVLTPKECAVLRLMLHGYSAKSMAQKLDNSLETIKHHRKRIYSKLDIGSQAELFYLFIDAVRSAPLEPGGDPLAAYLGHGA